MTLRTDLPLRHPSTRPSRQGVYVRDWRGTDALPVRDRRLSVDLYCSDAEFSGWYVLPDINDATEQALPWRPAGRQREERTGSARMGAGAKGVEAMITIGIDVGVTGAVAAIDSRGTCAIEDLPVVEDAHGKRIQARALVEILRRMCPVFDGVPTVVMERIRVLSIPGRRMSHSTETTLVMCRGAVQAVADMQRWPVVLVEPRAWKRWFGLAGKDRDPNATDDARSIAAKLYPQVAHMLARKRDHNRAEALLIAHYGRREVLGTSVIEAIDQL
jgi:crossover junction endodeoxyribonuclease RuvC